MNLLAALNAIDKAVSEEDRKYIAKMRPGDLITLHFSFGRWIRNECGLWSEGTENILTDIKKLYDSGFESQVLLDEVELRLLSEKNNTESDDSLEHPDNLSFLIIRLYHELINNKTTLAAYKKTLGE